MHWSKNGLFMEKFACIVSEKFNNFFYSNFFNLYFLSSFFNCCIIFLKRFTGEKIAIGQKRGLYFWQNKCSLLESDFLFFLREMFSKYF